MSAARCGDLVETTAVFATLYAMTNRPFSQPESGMIALEVISPYGDEAMRPFMVE